jgi:K+-transporting ATPase c subunit
MDDWKRFAAAVMTLAALGGCKREAPPSAPAPGPVTGGAETAPAKPAAAPPATAPSAAAPASAPAAVTVTSATLGSAVNADKRVTAATDTFKPADTIFLAVETSGSGAADLTARWTYSAEGQVTRVHEETQKVSATGPAVTEFHVRKPDGWPLGDYQVVVLVDNDVAATKKFSVK